jgi:hypothetical protein
MKNLRERAPTRVTNQDRPLGLVGKPAVLFDFLEETNGCEVGRRFLKQSASADDLVGGNSEIAFEAGLYVAG